MMILHVLRALFILLMAAAGWYFLNQDTSKYPVDSALRDYSWLAVAATLALGVFVVCIDILSPRKKLAVFSGTFLGLLVGMLLAYAASFVVRLVIDHLRYNPATALGVLTDVEAAALTEFAVLALGIVFCYLSISFILQTKDDFRFIIPYVEFKKQTKGGRPVLLDTSALIDGRVADIAGTGFFDSELVVPRFVLNELQAVADSGDRLKRNRGRRGLEVLARLQNDPRADVSFHEGDEEGPTDVDRRLVHLATEIGARILTTDFNLNKVAQLSGVDVLNVNDLANAMKQEVLPGEQLSVMLVQPGQEQGQGVGFLDDGTMVVVEQGRGHLNEQVELTVTNTRQTSQGKMIFGRLINGGTARREPGARHRAEAAEAESSPS